MKNIIKKNSLRNILKKYKGKGGVDPVSPYKQADAPIDLLKIQGEPPTASSVPNTKDNFIGNRFKK